MSDIVENSLLNNFKSTIDDHFYNSRFICLCNNLISVLLFDFYIIYEWVYTGF